jgi:hypothetical protein
MDRGRERRFPPPPAVPNAKHKKVFVAIFSV